MGHLPHRWAIRLGSVLGELAWRIRIRRRVALGNLMGASGIGGSPEVAGRIARACYHNIGRVAAEYARLPRLRAGDYARIIRYDGLHHIESAMGAGKGTIALSGHFGSLELMAASFCHVGFKPSVLVAPMRNPLATKLFLRYREAAGMGVIPVGVGVRAALQRLRRGGLLCLAADQDAGGHGIFAEFLGRPASTATGPVELAMRSGAPIVFGLAFREGLDRHIIRIRAPVWVKDQGGREATLRYYTELFARWLEEGVRERPDHWFWLHRRWKTRPEGSPS